MGKNCVFLLLILLMFLAGCSSASASPAAKIVTGVVTKVVSTIFKRLWSLKSTTKTPISSRSMMKFEGGYTVETLFDGSKLGIEPYMVEISPDGEVFILDSQNSNVYKIPTPLSRYSRPKLLVGSADGYTGHVDGKLRQARLNHPKGLTVDDSGNVYVADTMNYAIRKISDTGVVTIAGGKLGRGGHVDGPSEDAKFSDDFDVVYVGSSCSLLVMDRGNQAIREIQLHEDDCSHHEDINLHLVVGLPPCGWDNPTATWWQSTAQNQSILKKSCLFLKEPKAYAKAMPPAANQRPPSKSVLPPLIPPENDYVKQEEGFFRSLGKLLVYTGSSITDIFGGLFTGFRKKPIHNHMQPPHHYPSRHVNTWAMQDSFVIPREDEPPPPLDNRDPTPRKSYPSSTKDLEKMRQFKQSGSSYYNEWNGDYRKQHPQRHVAQLQHHQKHRPSSPQTRYEPQSCETNEIVFGAVQEQDGWQEAMVIKAVDYGDPVYDNGNVRSRYNYMSYSYGY